MEKSKKFSIPISRRDFMKLAAISAAAIAVGGENPSKAEAATPSVKFDTNIPVIFDTDVCVVGGGAARRGLRRLYLPPDKAQKPL